jgi:hydrogenase maturation protease
MSPEAAPQIAVLGLGNLMRTDDGVGVHAIGKLLASNLLPPGVEVIEGGTLGLDLLPRIEGVSHLLAIDAVDFGAPPGALSRFAGAELATLPAGKSIHLLGFSDLVAALRLLGRAPREVVLLGVQPESTDWGVTLSHRVAAVLDDLLAAALAEIHGWLQGAPAGMALSGDASHS